MASWSQDVNQDLLSVVLAACIVGLYTIIFMGSCTPIHCRVIVALGGIVSVILSFFAGFGLLFYTGLHVSTFHAWLPFLLMCIGVEHMFVIVNAID